MADRKGIVAAITQLQSLGVQGGPDLTDRASARLVVNVWLESFEKVGNAELLACVRAWVNQPGREGAFFPTPGGLRGMLPENRLNAIDDADEAWARVLKLAEHGQLWSAYGDDVAELTPREAVAVQAAGGRRAIAMSPYEMHTTMRASFRSAWRSAKERKILIENNPDIAEIASGAQA